MQRVTISSKCSSKLLVRTVRYELRCAAEAQCVKFSLSSNRCRVVVAAGPGSDQLWAALRAVDEAEGEEFEFLMVRLSNVDLQKIRGCARRALVLSQAEEVAEAAAGSGAASGSGDGGPVVVAQGALRFDECRLWWSYVRLLDASACDLPTNKGESKGADSSGSTARSGKSSTTLRTPGSPVPKKVVKCPTANLAGAVAATGSPVAVVPMKKTSIAKPKDTAKPANVRPASACDFVRGGRDCFGDGTARHHRPECAGFLGTSEGKFAGCSGAPSSDCRTVVTTGAARGVRPTKGAIREPHLGGSLRPRTTRSRTPTATRSSRTRPRTGTQ